MYYIFINLAKLCRLYEWWEEYVAEMELINDTTIAGFKTFQKVKRSDFSHVKFPKITRLGKCSICMANRQARMNCNNYQDIERLKQDLRDHFTITYGEKNHYHKRRLIASQNPSAILSLIMDKTKDIALPHIQPIPKSWLRVARQLVGIVGILNHSLGTKEFVLFSPEQWKLDSDFFITVLHQSIVTALLQYKQDRPRILYVQADNSAAEAKNQFLLLYFATLIHYGIFDEVHFHTLIPGHTHEDIDQLFSTLHQAVEKENNIETIPALINFIKSGVYSTSPKVTWMSRVYNWKQWFEGFGRRLKGHKSPHAFLVKKSCNGQIPGLWYKKYARDPEWLGDLNNELFFQPPNGFPSQTLPGKVDVDSVHVMVNSCKQLLSETAINWWLKIHTNILSLVQAAAANPFAAIHEEQPAAADKIKFAVVKEPVITLATPNRKKRTLDDGSNNALKRSKRHKSDTSLTLRDLLIDLLKSFEQNPNYGLGKLQNSFANLVGVGSAYVADMKLMKMLQDEAKQCTSRGDMILFLQHLVDDFNSVFKGAISK